MNQILKMASEASVWWHKVTLRKVFILTSSTWVWLDVQRCFRRQPSCFCMLWWARLQWKNLQQPISAAHSSNRWGHTCLRQDGTCDQAHGLPLLFSQFLHQTFAKYRGGWLWHILGAHFESRGCTEHYVGLNAFASCGTNNLLFKRCHYFLSCC